MTRQTRIFLTVAGTIATIGMSAVFLMAANVAEAGMAYVHVREKTDDGAHFTIPVPMSLAAAMVHMVPDEEFAEDTDEDLEFVLPVIAAMLADLADQPDGPLIQVDSADEKILIQKVGRSLRISVDDAETEVRVSFPIRSVARLLGDIDVKARKSREAGATAAHRRAPEPPPAQDEPGLEEPGSDSGLRTTSF